MSEKSFARDWDSESDTRIWGSAETTNPPTTVTPDPLTALRAAVKHLVMVVYNDGTDYRAARETIEREAARLVLSELEAQSEIPLGTDARIAYWRAKCQEMSGEL